MKALVEFEDAEKIKLFDQIHKTTLKYYNDIAVEVDGDNIHYFYEEMSDLVLKLTKADWERHGNGKSIPAPAPRTRKSKPKISDDYVEGQEDYT